MKSVANLDMRPEEGCIMRVMYDVMRARRLSLSSFEQDDSVGDVGVWFLRAEDEDDGTLSEEEILE